MNKERYAIITAESDDTAIHVHQMEGTPEELCALLGTLVHAYANHDVDEWRAMRKTLRYVLRQTDPYKETKKRLRYEGVYALLGAMVLIGAIWCLSVFAHAVWRLLV